MERKMTGSTRAGVGRRPGMGGGGGGHGGGGGGGGGGEGEDVGECK